jgi:hypothetical protein
VGFLSTLMDGVSTADLRVLDHAATLMERLVADARAR